MTILEAIQSKEVFSDLSENTLNSALISRSLDGSAVYDSSSLKSFELSCADLYYDMAVLPNYKEGQLSVEYKAEMLLKKAENIYRRYNDPKLAEFGATKINVGISKA